MKDANLVMEEIIQQVIDVQLKQMKPLLMKNMEMMKKLLLEQKQVPVPPAKEDNVHRPNWQVPSRI